MDDDPGYHFAENAKIGRRNAETFASYLAWSDDPDQRRWADAKAQAAERDAEADEEYAAALRRRVTS